MKTYYGSGSTAMRILDLDTIQRRVVSFTPRPPHTQERSPWFPFDRMLGGPQSRSEGSCEENLIVHLQDFSINTCQDQ